MFQDGLSPELAVGLLTGGLVAVQVRTLLTTHACMDVLSQVQDGRQYFQKVGYWGGWL